jgi:SAM-dependent methyltransferase
MTDKPQADAMSTREAREALRGLIHGYLRTQVLHAAAVLKIADHLANEPLTQSALASKTNADPNRLKRLLNGLTAMGIVGEERGEYRLTAVGEGLREDVPGSLASYALLSGEEYYQSWLGLDPLARDGTTPFERVLGAPLFTWYAEHPEAGARFNQRMATRITSFAAAVAGCCDLGSARRIVDLGGGYGLLLAAFLRRWPDARGVLFDLRDAVAAGERFLTGVGLAERVEFVSGNFFRYSDLPRAGDVYVLSQILHDWDDELAALILRNIRRVIGTDARLLVVEMLLPERVTGPNPTVDLDLIMLVLTGGQERTRAQFEQLLVDAGFSLEHVHVEIAPGGISVLEAHPA